MSYTVKPFEILFVDDEHRLLDGLRRAVHGDRDRWNCRFVLSGKDAMAELERATADVVITDMRMPCMDGASLLELVAEHHPHVVRVILSGQADEHNALRSAGVAHRFLAKPLATQQLRRTIAAIEEACAELPCLAQRSMANSELLPINQATYEIVASALNAPVVEINDLAHCVETDTALTARVLQLAHSSMLGGTSEHISVDRAIRTIGLDTLREFVGGEQMRRAASPRLQPRVDEEHQRALDAARTAARNAPGPVAESAFITELLRGLGRLFQAACDLPENPREAAALTNYLLGVWGLPGMRRTAEEMVVA